MISTSVKPDLLLVLIFILSFFRRGVNDCKGRFSTSSARSLIALHEPRAAPLSNGHASPIGRPNSFTLSALKHLSIPCFQRDWCRLNSDGGARLAWLIRSRATACPETSQACPDGVSFVVSRRDSQIVHRVHIPTQVGPTSAPR